MTQSFLHTVSLLLILCLLVPGVSLQEVTNSAATRHILGGPVSNACTLVVCAPPEVENRNQELDHLRKEVRAVQAQLNVFRAAVNEALKVLLMPYGVRVADKTFKTDGTTGDYETAKSLCSQMNSTIASPRNAKENEAVQQIVMWQNKKAVLGINDVETEGRFVYMNGEKIRYSNWALGEPNNVENEDCIEMHPDGKWHDRGCGLVWLVICEFQTVPLL